MTPNSGHAIRNPLHNWHLEHGAHFVDRTGRRLLAHYGNVQSEVAAIATGIGLADISSCSKLRLDGPGVGRFASQLAPDGALTKPGDVATLDCNGPAIACRLTDRTLFLTTSEANPTLLAERFSSLPETVATDLTMAMAGFILVGPRCEDLLGRVTALDLSTASVPPGRCSETSVAGVHALLVRPPRSTIIETRVYVPPDVAEYLWDKLLHAGRDFGITAVGLESLGQIRVTP